MIVFLIAFLIVFTLYALAVVAMYALTRWPDDGASVIGRVAGLTLTLLSFVVWPFVWILAQLGVIRK